MSRAGEIGMLMLILAACAVCWLFTPGKPAAMANGALLGLWIVLAIADFWHRRRSRV